MPNVLLLEMSDAEGGSGFGVVILTEATIGSVNEMRGIFDDAWMKGLNVGAHLEKMEFAHVAVDFFPHNPVIDALWEECGYFGLIEVPEDHSLWPLYGVHSVPGLLDVTGRTMVVTDDGVSWTAHHTHGGRKLVTDMLEWDGWDVNLSNIQNREAMNA